MDKLELDARLLRLERRVGFLSAVMLLAGVALGAFLTLGLFALRASPRPTARVVIPAPAPPATPAPPGMGAAAPVPLGMMGPMDMMMMGEAEGGVPALQHKLTALKGLHDEGLVAEAEWQAMKARALEAPLTPGDLRGDLQAVQHLFDAGAIGETERAEIRAKLLGIGQ